MLRERRKTHASQVLRMDVEVPEELLLKVKALPVPGTEFE